MITIDSLSVSYPDKTTAINNLSFIVEEGESIALVGANGAGKSSLLLTLSGVLPISGGTVSICGVPVTKNNLNDIRRLLGVVFQNPDDQLFMPTIFDDVAFGPLNFGLSESEAASRASAALEQLNISYLKDRSPLKLSGGEKRTAAIASVLAMQPSVMLFDEPSAFLDPRARRNLISLMNKLPQTKIVATHDLNLAVQTCHKTLILKSGELFAVGTPTELFYDEPLMEACGLEALPV